MSAEIAARITAARAARDDFEAQARDYAIGAGPEPSWTIWAGRLSSALGALLDALGDGTEGA